MSARMMGLAAGTVLVAGAALAGCSSADDSAGAAPRTNVASPQASGPNAAAPGAGAAQDPSPTGAAHAGGGSADTVSAGGRCDIGQQYTTGLVVDGSMDCATLGDVWSQAVADPAFAHHGNHNTITVGDWTCRAHQTRPVQTGFCENNTDYTKFKVIHT